VGTGVDVPLKSSYVVTGAPPSEAGADHVSDTVDPETDDEKAAGADGAVGAPVIRAATSVRIAGSWA
jgi:hypothetical protein